MGYVTCGIHPRQRCCWRCDRCPKCEPQMGRLRRGDYCADCTAKNKAEGLVWSDYCKNWIKPEDHRQMELDHPPCKGCGTRVKSRDMEYCASCEDIRAGKEVSA